MCINYKVVDLYGKFCKAPCRKESSGTVMTCSWVVIIYLTELHLEHFCLYGLRFGNFAIQGVAK